MALTDPVSPALEAYQTALDRTKVLHAAHRELEINIAKATDQTREAKNKLLQVMQGCGLLSVSCKECVVEMAGKHYMFLVNSQNQLNDVREIRVEKLKEKK
jgi:hypothetical protein